MNWQEQGDRESVGLVEKKDCTHYYQRLTYDGIPGVEGWNATGHTCANPKCKEFFPIKGGTS